MRDPSTPLVDLANSNQRTRGELKRAMDIFSAGTERDPCGLHDYWSGVQRSLLFFLFVCSFYFLSFAFLLQQAWRTACGKKLLALSIRTGL